MFGLHFGLVSDWHLPGLFELLLSPAVGTTVVFDTVEVEVFVVLVVVGCETDKIVSLAAAIGEVVCCAKPLDDPLIVKISAAREMADNALVNLMAVYPPRF